LLKIKKNIFNLFFHNWLEDQIFALLGLSHSVCKSYFMEEIPLDFQNLTSLYCLSFEVL